MVLSDHTTITVLRVGWVIDALCAIMMHWAALSLLQYLDANPSAGGPGADALPDPNSRRWLWRTAGGGRVLRFAWSSATVHVGDQMVRRYAWTLRLLTVMIFAALLAMLFVTAGHPDRHWSLVQGAPKSFTQAQAG
jgi:hypothetical protein